MSNRESFLQLLKALGVSNELETLLLQIYEQLTAVEENTLSGFERMSDSIKRGEILRWADLTEYERTNCISAVVLSRIIHVLSSMPDQFEASVQDAIEMDNAAKKLVAVLSKVMPQGTKFSIDSGHIIAELPNGEKLTNFTQKEGK